MRHAGRSPEAIYAALQVENQRLCQPPLPDNEIAKLARAVGKYMPDPLAGVTITGVAPAAEPTKLRDIFRPFPINSLPRPLSEFVRQGAQALGCDPTYFALPILAVVASALGNTRTIRLKNGWDEPAIIWAVVVGESGSLKSPAGLKTLAPVFRRQKQLLEEFHQENAQYQQELEEHKAAKKNARKDAGKECPEPPEKPRLRRVVCSDITIEKVAEVLEDNPRGTLVARDELAGWFGSFTRYKGNKGGTDLPNWLEMFRAGTVVVDRKTGERPTLFIPRAAVSVVGGITPRTLAKALTLDALDCGLAARLLMALSPKVPKRWSEAEIGLDIWQAYEELVDGLLTLDFDLEEGKQVPYALRLSKDARDLWVSFYNNWAQEQAAAEGDMAAALSKLEGYAPRLGLVHHVVSHLAVREDDKRPVGPSSIQAGITLVRWFAHEARRIYTTLSESTEERDRRTLADFIQTRGGTITVRELMRANCRRFPNVESAELALSSLVKFGVGRWEHSPSGPEGGRPSEMFILGA
jgi:hypothetical protein